MLTGFPYVALTIVIPERFQIVNGEDVLMAGVHILPLLGACAMGSFLGGAISSKRNNTSVTLILASFLQLLGIGLMILVSHADSSPQSQYGFQAIFGLGVGLSFSATTIMTNVMASEDSERASAQGAVAQARVLGGCIGLSICTVVLNEHVNRDLGHVLSGKDLAKLHRTPLSSLDWRPDLRDIVKAVYAGAFAHEMKIMVFVCAATVFISLFCLERHPPPLEQMTTATKENSDCRRDSDSATELNSLSRRQSI